MDATQNTTTALAALTTEQHAALLTLATVDQARRVHGLRPENAVRFVANNTGVTEQFVKDQLSLAVFVLQCDAVDRLDAENRADRVNA